MSQSAAGKRPVLQYKVIYPNELGLADRSRGSLKGEADNQRVSEPRRPPRDGLSRPAGPGMHVDVCPSPLVVSDAVRTGSGLCTGGWVSRSSPSPWVCMTVHVSSIIVRRVRLVTGQFTI